MHRDDYVELDRRFVRRAEDQDISPDFADWLIEHEPEGERVYDWGRLLEHGRVVILGEAGSGKTWELQARAELLRDENKDAFFLPIERIGPGSWPEMRRRERFEQWLASSTEAYFFLDAVDEAELRNKKLENALEHLEELLGDAWTRARLILSSRVSDWLPYTHKTVVERLPPARAGVSALAASNPLGRDLLVVQLSPLSTRQIALLAPRYGVTDTDKFIQAIRTANAGIFAGRPGDLERLARHWLRHGKLGTLTELIESDVQEKLREAKPRRPERRNLAVTDARKDIEDLAAAALLCKRSMFSVHDEKPTFESHDDALDPVQILRERSSEHIATLLDRPLFDPATYGRVQFHHRSIYEYLAARWLERLLRAGCSRASIERLLINEADGQRVIIPSMAPVAAWVAGLADEIRDSVRDCAPEVLIEHGDPELIPLPVRETLLRQLAQQCQREEEFWDYFDPASLRRFVHSDLASVICELLADPELPDRFCMLLFSLMQLGRIAAGAEAALRFAIDETRAKEVRASAIYALSEIGSNLHVDALASYAAELRKGPPRVTAALCTLLFRRRRDVNELLSILTRAGQQPLLTTNSLAVLMEDLIHESMCAEDALLFAEHVAELLDGDAKRKDDIAAERRWLLALLKYVLEKIIDQSSSETFPLERMRPVISFLCTTDSNDARKFEIHGILKRHAWLRRLLFWEAVAVEREGKPRMSRYYDLPWNAKQLLGLSIEDVSWLLKDARESAEILNQLLAVDTAFRLSPLEDLGRLEAAVRDNEILSRRYNRSLARATAHPNNQGSLYKAQYRLSALAAARRLERAREENRQALLTRIQGIREGQDMEALRWLRDQMERSNSRWGLADWRSLVVNVGQDVAEAARDGWPRYWRTHWPVLPCECTSNATPFSIIVGLTGLAIDFAEGLEPLTLEAEQARIAVRYALHEINGLPDWFEKLAESWPAETREVFALALASESKRDPEQQAYRGAWNQLGSLPISVRRIVAPAVLDQLTTAPPQQGESLRCALGALVDTEEYDDARLVEAGARHIQAPNLEPESAALWWTTWLRMQPMAALQYLEQVRSQASGRFAELFLMIARVNGPFYDIRKDHHWPEALPLNVLERLVTMAYEAIHPRDDIDRRNGGAFSPGARDDQQSFRYRLVNQLAGTVGSARALNALSALPQMQLHRRWFLRLAHTRLGLDAELAPWKPENIADFAREYELPPQSADALFDIALERLADVRDEIQRGDYSYRNLFTTRTLEVEIQRWLASLLRITSRARYQAPREAEVDRSERTDIRLYAPPIAGYVTIEIKRAHELSYRELVDALTVQLVGKYLRDRNSRHGILLLCNMQPRRTWLLPDTGESLGFADTLQRLDQLAQQVSHEHAQVERLRVVGIDFTQPASL